MNRFIAVSLSAAILFTNGTAAFAKEKVRDEQPVIITETKAPETAEDFIKAYAGCTIQITKDKKTADEFVWYEMADEQNYLLLLEGRDILKILPEDVQKEISDAYQKQNISYEKLIEQAEAIDQKIKDKAAKELEAKKAAEARDSSKEQPAGEESSSPEKNSEPSAQKPAEKTDQASASGQNAQPQKSEKQASEPVQENKNVNNTASSSNTDNNTDENQQAEPVKTKPETADPNPSGSQEDKKPQSDSEDAKLENKDEENPSGNQDEQNASSQKPAKPAGEILYQSSLTSGSLGSITFTASGNRINEPDQDAPQIAEAVRSYLKSDAQENSTADLYSDVVFYSENKDLSASSETMMAARTPEKTVFFEISVDEEAKNAVITPKNPASISIDYNTQAIMLKNEAPFETKISSAEDSEPELDAKDDPGSSEENLTAPEISELPSKPVLMMKPQPAGPAADPSVFEAETSLQTPVVSEKTDNQNSPEQNTDSENAAETQKPVLFDSLKEDAARSAEVSEILKKAAEPVQAGSIQSSIQTVEKKNSATGGITADARLNSSAVSSFISRYCSNAQGLIYLQAWSANYQQIMSGYSVWRTLDAADKQAINQRLAEVGSPTFTALYRQAHRISLGLGIGSSSTQVQRPAVNKTPATGNAEHGMTYSFITVFSAFLAALFLRKSFQRDNKQNSN